MSPIKTYRSMASGAKNIVKLGAVAVIGLIALGVVSLTLALTAGSKADTGISLAQAIESTNTDVFCPIWQQGVEASKSFSPTQTVTESGLKLYALFWNAYDRQGCAHTFGALPKPPAQLAPYLPEHLR